MLAAASGVLRRHGHRARGVHAAPGASDRVHVPRRRPAVPQGHHVPALRVRALRPHAAGRHQPRTARPRRRALRTQARDRRGGEQHHDPRPSRDRTPRSCATASSPSPRAAGPGCDRSDSGRHRRPSRPRTSPTASGTGCIPPPRCCAAGWRSSRSSASSSPTCASASFEIFFGRRLRRGRPDRRARRARARPARAASSSRSRLLLFIGGFYLSWRMHTFRITDEQVEVRSGILFRTNRKGRLDRIQGINIVRPFFARLFGAARLEVNVAGSDGNVQLAYLSGVRADELRRDILLLASGTQQQKAAAARRTGSAGAEPRRAARQRADRTRARPGSRRAGLDRDDASGAPHRVDAAELDDAVLPHRGGRRHHRGRRHRRVLLPVRRDSRASSAWGRTW